ncbi:hypothetical protein HGM15179_019767, partial [Zosterops borbonicus]
FQQRLLQVLLREGPLSPPRARLRFVETWRGLPGFGLGHFVVRFRGSARDEVLAVGPSRLLRVELGSGAVTRSWSYRDLRQWDVNWDSQQVTGGTGDINWDSQQVTGGTGDINWDSQQVTGGTGN